MQTVELDLVRKLSREEDYPTIHVKQGDIGRKFKVIIRDDGADYEIPKDAWLSVWYVGTSGDGNYSTIGDRSAFEINGNSVVVELITQMLVNDGGGSLCLIIHGMDGTQIGLWNIPYAVEKVRGARSVAATSYYTALSESVLLTARSAENADLSARQAAESAAHAQSVIDGFDILQVYPVGSVYFSLESISPASIFGGTWEQLKERFLFGSGENYSANDTGGEDAHTLTIDEMPSHNHNLANNYLFYSNKSAAVTPPSAAASGISNLSGVKQFKEAGGNQPHNNMPPYLVVNMWKRVA